MRTTTTHYETAQNMVLLLNNAGRRWVNAFNNVKKFHDVFMIDLTLQNLSASASYFKLTYYVHVYTIPMSSAAGACPVHVGKQLTRPYRNVYQK